MTKTKQEEIKLFDDNKYIGSIGKDYLNGYKTGYERAFNGILVGLDILGDLLSVLNISNEYKKLDDKASEIEENTLLNYSSLEDYKDHLDWLKKYKRQVLVSENSFEKQGIRNWFISIPYWKDLEDFKSIGLSEVIDILASVKLSKEITKTTSLILKNDYENYSKNKEEISLGSVKPLSYELISGMLKEVLQEKLFDLFEEKQDKELGETVCK
ncbi:hypothetical protein [Anaerococcus prevotii]|uniref:Conserved domain protein n=1 Tax=Anaerococcus prevotii ACS-065-V-Col13 TaxID=879305 RepID=F0GU41_9FIRM|nr:hypothetical protein [Anaerococcus prevotii]EGC82468.1 conserved domain protein [Anaerococcus prevotii ACS-065-V-Col13]